MQHPASGGGAYYTTAPDSADDSSQHDDSALEEDVCFPNDKKVDEDVINYNELDNYIQEIKSSEQLELSPRSSSISPSSSEQQRQRQQQEERRRRRSTLRRYSLYGDRDRYTNGEKQDRAEGRVTLFSVTESQPIHAKSLDDIPTHAARGGYQQLSDLLKKGCFWLDILSPSDAEMKILSKTFHIHPLTVEDISMEEQREKCEVYKNYYFICFRSFEQNRASVNYLQPLALYIIVMKEGVLTVKFK